MKNLKLALFAVLTMSLVLTSCSDDDSKGNDTSANLEGTWEPSREGEIINGVEKWNDYEHTAGCSKDYIVVTSDKVKNVYYNGEECTEVIDESTYVRNGNNIVFDDMDNGEIVTLSSSTLTIKFVDTSEDGGADDIYFSEFKRK